MSIIAVQRHVVEILVFEEIAWSTQADISNSSGRGSHSKSLLIYAKCLAPTPCCGSCLIPPHCGRAGGARHPKVIGGVPPHGVCPVGGGCSPHPGRQFAHSRVAATHKPLAFARWTQGGGQRGGHEPTKQAVPTMWQCLVPPPCVHGHYWCQVARPSGGWPSQGG